MKLKDIEVGQRVRRRGVDWTYTVHAVGVHGVVWHQGARRHARSARADFVKLHFSGIVFRVVHCSQIIPAEEGT